MREDVWKLILTASRLPANVGLDLKAMIAANTHARKGLLRLVDRYGAEEVVGTMRGCSTGPRCGWQSASPPCLTGVGAPGPTLTMMDGRRIWCASR